MKVLDLCGVEEMLKRIGRKPKPCDRCGAPTDEPEYILCRLCWKDDKPHPNRGVRFGGPTDIDRAWGY